MSLYRKRNGLYNKMGVYRGRKSVDETSVDRRMRVELFVDQNKTKVKETSLKHPPIHCYRTISVEKVLFNGLKCILLALA
jgi:hypothetical protein